MLAFEAASFDVTTGMAGHLGSVETAAHAAVLGIIYFTYSALPWAISTAATIRCGQPCHVRQESSFAACLDPE